MCKSYIPYLQHILDECRKHNSHANTSNRKYPFCCRQKRLTLRKLNILVPQAPRLCGIFVSPCFLRISPRFPLIIFPFGINPLAQLRPHRAAPVRCRVLPRIRPPYRRATAMEKRTYIK